MKVLIIGGSGVISTAIVNLLLEKGHQVAIVNRGRTGRRFRGEVEQIVADRSDLKSFEEQLAGVSCDAVIDMICFFPEQAASAYRIFRGRVAHFIHTSTGCAVGGPLEKLPSDETEPYKPVNDYGINKMKTEQFHLAKHQEEGWPVTVVRPAYTYGPGAPMLHIWIGPDPYLIDRLRRGLPVIIHGDGNGTAMATHVDDAAKAYVGILGKNKTLGQIYYAVNDERFTWRDYYERVATAVGGTANLVPVPTDVLVKALPAEKSFFLDKILRYPGWFSNAKLKRDVPEFQPELTLEEGVRRTVEWLDANNQSLKCPDDYVDDVIAQQLVPVYERLKV